MKTEHGCYIDIEHTAKGLKLILNPALKEEFKESLIGTNKSLVNHFFEIFEDHLCSGWEFIKPEDIGALTACPYIFSNDAWHDDQGVLKQVDTIYWYPDYSVADPVTDLVEKGYTELVKVTGD